MKTQRRILSLLLVLATLISGLTVLFPVATAADSSGNLEIEDFTCYPSPDFSIGAAYTSLYFTFTIGSLDYDEFGFVFSLENGGNNPTPVRGDEGCIEFATSESGVAARIGNQIVEAPAGRSLVPCALDVPFERFYEWIYARAFVTDSTGTRYSDVMKLSVMKMNRVGNGPINEAIGTASTVWNDVIEDKRNLYSDVLCSGAKTFCPNEVNPEGNDLLIEYSVFYNDSLVQYLKNTNAPYVTSRIAKDDFSESAPLNFWSPCANCWGSDCPYAGGFDALNGLGTLVSDDEVTTPAGMGTTTGAYADYPNLGGAVQSNPEYGWHRIGVRVHEDVTVLPTANTDAEYLFTVTTYLDGVAVSKLQGTLMDERIQNYLYTASYNASTGKVEYTDVGADRYVFIYRMKYQGNSYGKHQSAYCVFADASASCGKEFVRQVEPVVPVENGPNDGGYRAENGKGFSAPRYYRNVPDDPQYPHSFTAMSYNVEVFNKGWSGRHPKALQTVLAASPDIVGFQEYNERWDTLFNALAKAGGYTRVTGDDTTDRFERNEIFFKTDKFTLLFDGTLVYKDVAIALNVPNPENANMDLDTHGRTFHYVVLEQKETGKRILVVNTHLHYGKTGDEAAVPHDKVRRYEIRALLAWLELQEDAFPDQIIMGDMNAQNVPSNPNNGGSLTIRMFLDDGFSEGFSAAAETDDVGGTYVNGHATRSPYVFDHFFTKGNIDTAYYTVVDNPVDGDGRYPSDHLPILARFCLR